MEDFTRFDVWPIVREHYRGLIDPGRRYVGLGSLLLIAGLPVLSAAGAALFGFAIPRTAVVPLLAASGVLVGAMITVFVMLTNLRVKMSESEKWSYRTRATRLVGQTVASALYSAVVSLVLVAGLLVGLAVPGIGATVWHELGSCVAVAITVHLAASLLTVFRRLFGVYATFFAADFGPALQAVAKHADPGAHRSAS